MLNYIKAHLRAMDVTQEALAARVGVSYRHLNRIVIGEGDPSPAMAKRICRVLGQPVGDVFPKLAALDQRPPRAVAS